MIVCAGKRIDRIGEDKLKKFFYHISFYKSFIETIVLIIFVG